MATFTREELEAKTSKELKQLCVYELNIPGLTKKDKETVINAIMAKHGKKATVAKVTSASRETPPVVKPSVTVGPMKGISFKATSMMSRPNAKFGDKTTTNITVSSGASSGAFPVAGRTVREVGDFLREVLNIDRLSTALVNGRTVDASHIIALGDNVEFVKAAGQKG